MTTSLQQVTAGRFQLVFARPVALGLETLKGVGPKTAQRLRERGITDQAELLLNVPRKYRPVYRFFPGPEMIRRRAAYIEFIGEIVRVIPPRRHSRAPMEVVVDCDGQTLKLIWFGMNQAAFTRGFQPGRWMHVEGSVDYDRGPTLAHPTFKFLGDLPAVLPEPQMAVEPIYSSIEGVKDSIIPAAVAQAAKTLLPALAEIVPARVLADHGMMEVRTALRTIHLLDPYTDLDVFRAQLDRARSRLVYEEFYTLQLKLAQNYVSERRAARAPRCETREVGRNLVKALPFPLTGDQNQAIARIADDIASRFPMRRLLQGDVGSGKTVVAFMAAAIAAGSGYQVALMAPTDILAKQHLRRAREFFDGLPIVTSLLTGSQSASDKRVMLHNLKHDKIDLLIGTHAVFQADVEFNKLGLVIIDEQHKFGVEQRQLLLDKGDDPHLLAMTATPIPRSLAHAVFGDLDLTIIAEKPPGRKLIRTVLRNRSRAQKVYEYVRDRIRDTGEQAFFVYPMVEASANQQDKPDQRRNVTAAAQELANGPLKGLRVGILHGRMDSDAKDAIMGRFATGELDVLCATTVIEVGMDVPNATLMVIESPELFGLSQLHQLRGRVGRGPRDSMCIMLAGFGLTPEAQERLTAFASTDDGFILAETDLRIRGPGQFLGQRQAGLAEFRFGDVLRDAALLEEARTDARRQVLGDAGG